jgi:predicted ATPase
MDLFYKSINCDRKRRVHFHKFMLEVHRMIHDENKELLNKYGRERHVKLETHKDVLALVAKRISDSISLLCFDEFQVTDIVDAIIMTKLFGELWKYGVVLIATSNRPPSDLYKGGLNRSYFLPFIEALESHCIQCHLDSTTDYRLCSTSLGLDTYRTPNSDTNNDILYEQFLKHIQTTYGEDVQPVKTLVPVTMGRTIEVLAHGDICWADFEFLCGQYRGASDYSSLCKCMRHIYISNIPVMSVLVSTYF